MKFQWTDDSSEKIPEKISDVTDLNRLCVFTPEELKQYIYSGKFDTPVNSTVTECPDTITDNDISLHFSNLQSSALYISDNKCVILLEGLAAEMLKNYTCAIIQEVDVPDYKIYKPVDGFILLTAFNSDPELDPVYMWYMNKLN